MALNLKTLATRSMSAVVFVILLVGCVYWNYYSFSIFFFVVAMLGLNEFYKISEKLGASPYKGIGFVAGIILYLRFVYLEGYFHHNEDEGCCGYSGNFGDLEKLLNGCVVILPFIILAVSLFSKKEKSIQNGLYTIGGCIYSVLPFALLNQTVFYDDGCMGDHFFTPWLILGIIFLIWSNDTFAYLGGSLMGKNKMIERVSPGKTWEGTIIGVLVTFGLSFLFDSYVYRLGSPMWPILGIAIPILATIGDLVESKLKREAGIKDSGNIMPGHGGILDRFDSLIFVSPFVFALFKL
jgi:phosphatidate cytidylyltransferase